MEWFLLPLETWFSLLKRRIWFTKPNLQTRVWKCIFLLLLFPWLIFLEDGGAIFYEIKNSNLLVEKCSFLNCSSGYDTSGVRVAAGNCVIAFTCSCSGFANHNDGFCSITLDTTRTINSVVDTSVARCEATASYTMYQGYGNVQIKSLNLSHNKASSVSALEYLPGDISSIIIFCSFWNNTADNNHCLSINGNMNHPIKSTNIIENNAKNTLLCMGEVDISQCTILMNAKPCFFGNGESAKIIINKCTIDDLNNSGQGSLIQNEATDLFINALSFIETQHCKNLFRHYYTSYKCRTVPEKYQLIHQIFIHSALIFLLYSFK